jgi:hypothetical protein
MQTFAFYKQGAMGGVRAHFDEETKSYEILKIIAVDNHFNNIGLRSVRMGSTTNH